MKWTVTLDGEELHVLFDEAYGERTLELEGQPHRVTLLRVQGDRVRFTVDDRPVEAVITGQPPEVTVDVGTGPLPVTVEESRFAAVRKISGLAQVSRRIADLKAPMPGLVTRILVQEGDAVETGRALVVMEAMKMENELRATGAGVVRQIKVAIREAVEQGQVLVTFD